MSIAVVANVWRVHARSTRDLADRMLVRGDAKGSAAMLAAAQDLEKRHNAAVETMPLVHTGKDNGSDVSCCGDGGPANGHRFVGVEATPGLEAEAVDRRPQIQSFANSSSAEGIGHGRASPKTIGAALTGRQNAVSGRAEEWAASILSHPAYEG